MKKANNLQRDEDMLPEYNFKGKKGVRGKYAKAMKKGYSVRVLNQDGTAATQHFIPEENAIVLEPDVQVYFPDSESVNSALRGLIKLIPEKNARRVSEKKTPFGKTKA